METDTRVNANWRLRKVKDFWYLDIAGKMKRLKMLDNATEVVLDKNILFADGVMHQIIEETGEVVISELESNDHKHITSESQQDETIIHMHLDDYSVQNIAFISEKREQNEEMRAFSDSLLENEGNDHSLDDEQEENYDIGSDMYVKKKGKVWRFIDRIKQFKKKKSGKKKTEEPLYEAVPHYSNNRLGDDLSGIGFDNEDNSFKEQVDDYADVSFVSDKKKVTAMFDFDKLSDEGISFKMFDELTILEDIVSENPAWCYAEHLLTGEKGFVPVAYITQADHNLIAQDWWHNINRDGAIELLTNLHRPTPGTYLLRRSGSNSFYVLSMIVPATYNNSQRILHYAIRSQQGRFYIIQGKQFSDLFDLVDHYKREADGLLCKLEIPAPRQKPIVYPMSIEVQRKSIEIIKSIKIGKFGVLYEGKLCNIFDVTIVTECKGEVERFLAEAYHLNKFLHSKHLVRVIAVVLEPNPFMIVLGETVQDTLQYYLEKCDKKTIAFKRLTNMAAEIAKGMAFLEENGIVHGNLKSENVFICENDKLKLLHPKLIKLMRTSANDEHKKGETEWQWTAPEVVAGESVLCTKSDVWSFGVVMYEIITFGGVPYAGLEQEETLQRLLKGYFRQPIPAQCPDEFYSTILQCWHHIPDCRLTFSFLYNYLDDFENASESENFLKDYKSKLICRHIYKKWTLKIKKEEQTRGKLKIEKEELAEALGDPNEEARVYVETDTHIDQTASNKNVDITPRFDATALDGYPAAHLQDDQSTNNRSVDITQGFDVTALYSFTTDTHIDQTASNKDVDITPGFEGKPLNDYTADLHDDQSTRNRIVDITPGFDVSALRGFTAETDDQISFDLGDIITNIEPINDDWWKGTTAKRIRGLFPATYVEVREITYAEVKNQNNVQKIIERMQLK